MNPIPWYKSPVYIGIVINIVAGLVNILGFQDLITVDAITSGVTQFFTVVGLGAALVAEWKRRKSAIQPIALTQAAADAKSTVVRSPALVSLFAILLTVLVVGCVTTPADVLAVSCQSGTSAYEVERCAKSIAEVYEVYQKRGFEIVENPGAPPDVKNAVRAADASATPVMVELLKSTNLYLDMKEQLAVGTTTEEKVAIANRELQGWVARALAQIDAFRSALGDQS